MRIASANGPGCQQLSLCVHFPPDYPSASAPVVELDADGLSDGVRQSLLQQLETMFEPGEVQPCQSSMACTCKRHNHAREMCCTGEVVVYNWASWLQEQEELWVQHEAAASPRLDEDARASPIVDVEAEAAQVEDSRAVEKSVQHPLVSNGLCCWMPAIACPQRLTSAQSKTNYLHLEMGHHHQRPTFHSQQVHLPGKYLPANLQHLKSLLVPCHGIALS